MPGIRENDTPALTQIMTFPQSFRMIAVFLVIVIGSAMSLNLNAKVAQSDADKRAKSLIGATTSTDSIRILLDVYNLSDKINRDKVRKQILNMVTETDNHELIGEVIKELSSTTDDAEALNRLIEVSWNLPESDKQKHLQTVLRMEQAEAEAADVKESQLQQAVEEYARQGLSLGGDPYKEIQNIYRTLMYIGASSQGPLYYEYIKRLEELVEALPSEDHAIRNLYYTTAAIFYTRKRDYKKAIEFDKKLIGELDAIKALYKKEGKAAPDLDYFYYVSNRRMLRNFRGLTPQEIEDTYNQCVEIASRNEEAAEAFGNGGLTKSYYYYATKQYDKAVPELKKALKAPDISNFRKGELLGLLGYALRQTGDKEGELQTLRQYSAMLLQDRRERRDDMYREIELRNSANRLLNDEYRQQQQQQQENRVMRKTSITLVYVLAVILIFLCGAYFRLRQKVRELEIRNSRLHRNIEYIFDDGVPKGTKDLRHQKNRLKG